MSSNYGFEPTLDGLNTIDSDSTTTTNIICDTIIINTSGTAPTVSALSNDSNIATTAWVNNHASGLYVTLAGASQTISSEKIFSNANTFITGALNAPTIKTTLGTSMTIATDPLGYTDDIDITTANDLNLTGGGISFNYTGLNFNGSDIFFNNTGSQTVFYAIPSCAITPTTANMLCNKTYVDSVSSSPLATNNVWTGTNTFSTNTLTASAGITVKNGASAQTATLTQNATTLDVIGSGDISIKPTNDFNVVTGTGKNITVSTPCTSLLPSSQTYTTGTSNTGSYIAFSSPTTYILGTSTQPSLIMSGGFGTIYGWQFTRGGTALAAINRINSQNTADTCYLEVNEGQNITLTDGATSITGNFLLNQTNTTTSMGTTQIGYTVEDTSKSTDSASTQVSNGVTKNILSFTPLKGVWVASFNWKLTANTSGGAGTVDGWEVCLSATSASLTQYRSFNELRELNDAIGGSGGVRDKGNLSGVINADGSTAYYINANIRFSGLAGPNTVYLAIPMLTYTRIG